VTEEWYLIYLRLDFWGFQGFFLKPKNFGFFKNADVQPWQVACAEQEHIHCWNRYSFSIQQRVRQQYTAQLRVQNSRQLPSPLPLHELDMDNIRQHALTTVTQSVCSLPMRASKVHSTNGSSAELRLYTPSTFWGGLPQPSYEFLGDITWRKVYSKSVIQYFIANGPIFRGFAILG